MEAKVKRKGITLSLELDGNEAADFKTLLERARDYWGNDARETHATEWAGICHRVNSLAEGILRALK